MKPNYVAKKSVWGCVSFLSIIACVLVIPLFVLIFRILATKQFRLEFYNDKIIIKSGLLNKKKKQMVFMGVTSVSVEQSLFGRIFGYGNVIVDCVGTWDINSTTHIKNPEALEEYLQTRINRKAGNPFVMM